MLDDPAAAVRPLKRVRGGASMTRLGAARLVAAVSRWCVDRGRPDSAKDAVDQTTRRAFVNGVLGPGGGPGATGPRRDWRGGGAALLFGSGGAAEAVVPAAETAGRERSAGVHGRGGGAAGGGILFGDRRHRGQRRARRHRASAGLAGRRSRLALRLRRGGGSGGAGAAEISSRVSDLMPRILRSTTDKNRAVIGSE